VPDPSIERFHRVVAVAYAHLSERRQEINDLNVFPVADGDTGDNMASTMAAVLEALEGLRTSALARIDRNLLVKTVEHAALMGARGNSGVILSQIVRGAAGELTTRRGDLIGPGLVRDATREAARAAYESVRDPQPGTMLTVIQEIADAVERRVAELGVEELAPGTTEAEQDAMLADLLGTAVGAGQAALERTTEQLDVLGEAGVVDAGAYGLMVLLVGLVAGLSGLEGPSPLPHQRPADLRRGSHWDPRYSHCTTGIITPARERRLDPEAILARTDELGDSVAVVGDETMVRAHVHTNEPERARAVWEEFGNVEDFEATDMREQVAARQARSGAVAPAAANGARTGVVAVASGEGIARLFAAEGAHVVDGGATLNPSIEDILSAIRAAPGAEVIVLPNSSNVLMAAEEAARLAERPVRVVASTSPQAGLAALVGGFDPGAPAAENAARLEEELESIRAGLVAPADRDDAEGRYRRGDAVGFLGDDLVAWGDPAATLRAVIARAAAGAEVVTVLEGRDAPVPASEVAAGLDGVELEVAAGGQPTYWWLVAAQ